MPVHIYISFTYASSRIAIRLRRKHSNEIRNTPPPYPLPNKRFCYTKGNFQESTDCSLCDAV